MVLHLKWPSVLLLSLFLFSLSYANTGPRFKKQNIEFVFKGEKKRLTLDAAINPQQHAFGLMNRSFMAENDGMIFIFQDERVREFWMKDTLIDLDIAYISKDKKIIDIQTMKAAISVLQTNFPTYPSKAPAKYAVEMNAGWFKKNKISLGATLKILTGPTSKQPN
jgi:uncharacterized membrane protein (UPF0127 family)